MSSFRFSRRRSSFAKQEPASSCPNHEGCVRCSISEARFALFKIKRDVAQYYRPD